MTVDLLGYITRANRLRPNTKRAYTNAVQQWLDFAGPSPAGWTAAAAQAFYDKLLADGIGIDTANNMITGGLAFALRRAAALQPGVVVDVTVAVDRRKNLEGDTRGERALTSPQGVALRRACAGTALSDLRDAAMVDLGLFTGMRIMSIVDVDLARVTDRGAYVLITVHIKGGASYRVPLDKRAWGLTHSYRQALYAARGDKHGPMFPGIRTKLMDGATFDVPTDALTISGADRALRRRARAARLTTFHPHLFRHTFATWCRVDKVEDYLIEVVTGHKSNRGLVHRVYTDENQLYADVAARCYEAVARRVADSLG